MSPNPIKMESKGRENNLITNVEGKKQVPLNLTFKMEPRGRQAGGKAGPGRNSVCKGLM